MGFIFQFRLLGALLYLLVAFLIITFSIFSAFFTKYGPGIFRQIFFPVCFQLPVSYINFVTNRRLIRKLSHQTLLRSRRTSDFLLLRSDNNVLIVTEIVLNNLVQYSHCQVV